MNNDNVSTLIEVGRALSSPSSIRERIDRGRAIGRLYVAAQHLSQAASDDACRLIEEADDPWQNVGFNQELAKSPYAVRVTKPLRLSRLYLSDFGLVQGTGISL